MVALGGVGMTAQMTYRTTKATFDRQMEAFESRPRQAREIEYFRTEAPKKLTAKEVLGDFRLQRFLLQSFGLSEMTNANALVEKVLTDDLDSEDALVWRMNDQRFTRMATTLRFDQGVGKLQFPNVVDQIVDRYLTNGFEASVGETSPEVRQALYFERRAGELTSMYQILGDRALRDVAVTIAGLPPQSANLDVDKQADLLAERIDVEKLKDPDYVKGLVEQYLAKVDAAAGPSGAGAGLLQLFRSGPVGGFSLDLLV
ncbi:MAG: DUF1217 domain-containing protein [Azospirillaceae bacterium]